MAKTKSSGAIKQGLPMIVSAKKWQASSLIEIPEDRKVSEARDMLLAGFIEKSEDGNSVIFNKRVIEHWEKDEGYDDKQINGRLAKIEMARSAVKRPREVWDQGKQKAFIQGFVKPQGGKLGVVVFVRKSDKTAITYFPKSIGGLDKVRKGTRIK